MYRIMVFGRINVSIAFHHKNIKKIKLKIIQFNKDDEEDGKKSKERKSYQDYSNCNSQLHVIKYDYIIDSLRVEPICVSKRKLCRLAVHFCLGQSHGKQEFPFNKTILK